jgi:hypothetical protein
VGFSLAAPARMIASLAVGLTFPMTSATMCFVRRGFSLQRTGKRLQTTDYLAEHVCTKSLSRLSPKLATQSSNPPMSSNAYPPAAALIGSDFTRIVSASTVPCPQ